MNEPALKKLPKLPQQLEALLGSGGSAEDFLNEIATRSTGAHDSAWETLALVDQLYRRGKLSAPLFQAAKLRIERRVLGVKGSAGPPPGLTQSPAHSPVPKIIVPSQITVPKGLMRPQLRKAALPLPPTVVLPKVAVAAVRAPAPMPVTVAEVEVRALRAELAHARKQATVYLEQLSVQEFRNRQSKSVTTEPLLSQNSTATGQASSAPVATVAIQQRAKQETGWRVGTACWRVSVPRVALCALAEGVMVLPLVLSGSSSVAIAERPPRPAPIVVALRTVPAPPAIPGVLSLGAARYVVAAGDHRAVLQLQRARGTSGAVSLEYWTVGLGAKAGRDFATHGRQTLTIADGQSVAQIQIPILANPRRKYTEMFDVFIGKPGGGAALGDLSRATVFILPTAHPANLP